MSSAHRGLTATSLLAAVLATGMAASIASSQLPAGWQSSGTGPKGYTVGYDVSRQSAGRQASGREERSAYIASNVTEPLGAASLTQAIRADDFRGRRVRLSGFVRQSSGAGNSATLFLRVEGNGTVLGTDRRSGTTAPDTIGGSGWIRHQIVVDVPTYSTGLRFGFVKDGSGEAWLRDVRLELVDTATPLTGVVLPANLDVGTPRAIAGEVASREATYRRLPKQPTNMDFMTLEPEKR